MEAGTSQPGPPPPRPPSGGGRADQDPGRTWRILAVVLALTLGAAGAIMIALMVDIAGTPRCADEQAIAEERAETGEREVECFEGERFQKAATVGLGLGAGGIAGAGALAALFFAGTGRRGELMIWLTGAAIVVGGLSILVGSI